MTMPIRDWTAVEEDPRAIPMDNRLRTLALWVLASLEPAETFNHRHSSYGLKHMAQHDLGIYCTNSEFKAVMLKLGYRAYDETQRNWLFNVSERSVKRIAARPLGQLDEIPFSSIGQWNDKFLP